MQSKIKKYQSLWKQWEEYIHCIETIHWLKEETVLPFTFQTLLACLAWRISVFVIKQANCRSPFWLLPFPLNNSIALCEVLRTGDKKKGRRFLYIRHNSHSNWCTKCTHTLAEMDGIATSGIETFFYILDLGGEWVWVWVGNMVVSRLIPLVSGMMFND